MSFFSLPAVLDLVAKATVILAVTGLIAAVLRRASASARHFVWTLGIVSALGVPVLTTAMPRWELPIVRVPAPAAALDTAVARDAAAAMRDRIAPAATSVGATATAAPAGPRGAVPVRALPSWPALAFMVWALGAAVILGRVLIGLLAVRWMSRRLPRVTDAAWLADAIALADGLGLRDVRFLRGAAGTMPMAWGIFRPSVVVPSDADSWPAHRVRVVLLHELAHVKRRDCLTHLVAQLACAAYWFNPLAWIAARQLRSERERACDDLVLAGGTRGSDYADQLLDIARVMSAGRFPAVLAGASLAMAKRSQLEGRLIAILDPGVARRGLSRTRAAAAAVLFAVVLMTVASVQPWAEERAVVKGEPQAAADDRVNATQQRPIQDAVQGQVQGQAQGAIHGAVAGGVPGGVARGPARGVAEGIAGEVATAVADAVVGGALGIVHEVTSEVGHELQNEREHEREQGRDKDKPARTLDPRAVNALMEALKDTDKEVRETAMAALVQMRDPRMFEPLVLALKDASADVREHAAFGLGQMRDTRAIEPLTAAIKDQSASVREQVVFALGQLRAAAAIEPLTMALRDSSDDVREQAAFALGQIHDKRSIDPLVSALKDPKSDVREQAAFALGQMRDARAVEALIVALKDADPEVREQAAFALGQIGDARAIDGLTAALKDTNSQVRQQAAFALGQIR